eukprot:5138749-Pleurochrysis_carterae.AAC.1
MSPSSARLLEEGQVVRRALQEFAGESVVEHHQVVNVDLEQVMLHADGRAEHVSAAEGASGGEKGRIRGRGGASAQGQFRCRRGGRKSRRNGTRHHLDSSERQQTRVLGGSGNYAPISPRRTVL